MTYSEARFMDRDDQILLRRLAEYVRPYPEKVLAETIGCTERTAKHFRSGTSWPTARHWRSIVQAFGRDVIAAVFEPEIDDTLARLNREQAQLEARLDEIRKRRRQAVGGLEGFPQRAAQGGDRPPLGREERRRDAGLNQSP